MNKRAQLWKETGWFILALIGGILVLFGLMYYTGLFTNFFTTVSTGVCTASALFRGAFLQFLWIFISMLLVIMTILVAISGGVGKTATGGKIHVVAGPSVAVGRSVLRLDIMTMMIMIITMFFSGIPLLCSPVTIHQGTFEKPITNNTKFAEFIGAKTVDCWDMYGQGNWNPLWGLDPPNPKTCFISEIHLETRIYGDQLYNLIEESFPDWKLKTFEGETNVQFYCPDNKGFNPKIWEDCYIQDSRVYIMYRDNHPFDSSSYGTGVCEGGIDPDSGWFGSFLGVEKDHIVVCIEQMY